LCKDDGIMTGQRRIGSVFVEFQPMSPDDMQRAMQFLLQQQAQYAADSADSQARFDERFEQLSGKIDEVASGLIGLSGRIDEVATGLISLTSIVDRVVDGVGRVVDGVGQIAEAQKRTDEQLKRTDEQLRANDARLTGHIDRVESHLNVVIEMFERHLREDHGHRPS
jgi:methyl-accepting chemotaxis protein